MITLWTNADVETASLTVTPALTALGDVQYRIVENVSRPVAPAHNEVVVAMGTEPVDLLKELGVFPKSRTLSSLRGKPIKNEDTGGWWMVSYNPNSYWVDSSKAEDIGWDIRLASRLHSTGSLSPKSGDYVYVEDLSSVIDRVNEKYDESGRRVDVAFDTETMGLYPYYQNKHLVTLQFTVDVGAAKVVYLLNRSLESMNLIREQMHWLLNTDRIGLRGANLKFDLIWVLVKWGVRCTNFRMDTLIVGSLLNENRSNSLNMHAKLFSDIGGYDDAFNDSVDKAHMELVRKDKLLQYAGGDTDACLQVSDSLKRQLLTKPRLAKFYTVLLHPAARAFEQIEARGVLVDRGGYRELESDLKKEIHVLETRMLSQLPSRLRAKHLLDIETKLQEGKTPFTGKLLTDFFFTKDGLNLKPKMFTEKTGVASTAYDHLVMFKDNAAAGPFVELYDQSTGARKTLSTYVLGFLEHLRPDGRFHPTYALYRGGLYGGGDTSGTVTGRLSAKEPAIQTIPKHTKWAKRIRKCFPAPPGKLVFQCDFSQGELKVTACVANEKKMINAYKNGIDMHAFTGAKLAGMEFGEFMDLQKTNSEMFKHWRSCAKPANFGLLYGMGAEGYREYARISYNLILTTSEAEAHRNAFFDLYPGLVDWHRTYRDLAHKNGFVVSPLGRVRNLPLIRSRMSMERSSAERQAINSPIQSCLSDMCLWSIAILEEKHSQPSGLEIIGMTHDSIYGYVPEGGEAMDWMREITGVMANLPFEKLGWEPQLKFTTDAELGKTLGDLESVAL